MLKTLSNLTIEHLIAISIVVLLFVIYKHGAAIFSGIRYLVSFLFPSLRLNTVLGHPFFSRLPYYINFVINDLPISSTRKKIMIQNFLRIFLNAFLLTYRDGMSIRENCRDNFHLDLFLDAKRKAEAASLDFGIPEIFLHKFNHFYRAHADVAIKGIQDICDSRYYSSCKEKQSAILDLLLATLAMLILDAERTANDLNGELDEVLK